MVSRRDGVPRNPVTRWLNVRAVRRVHAIDVRWLAARPLWQEGRFAEYADLLDELATAYAGETRVIDWRSSVFSARMRRCEALVRSGQPGLAEAEAKTLVAELVAVDGPDGPRQRTLRRRMDAAYHGEELPYD
jgi:hypothetical protein